MIKLFNAIKRWWYNRGKTYQPPAEKPEVKPKPEVPEQETGLAWYPSAVKGTGMKVQGKYAKGSPEGAVVHFTAGQCDTEQHAKDTLSWGIGEGYAFFVIGPTGVVYQNFPLTHWGHHAGSSYYPGLGSSVSNKLVGIEVACAGMVSSSGKSWFGKTFSSDRIRYSEKKANIQPGYYVKYTEAQEKALVELLLWLKKNNPDVFDVKYILGHDECCAPIGRKNDPGASLSMTMPELREKIKRLADN